MKNNMNFKIIIVSLFFGLLSACQQDMQTEENSVTKKSLHNKYATKPHAAIFMDFEILNAPLVNEPLKIKLQFKTGLDTESLQVQINPSSALDMASSASVYQFNKLAKGESESVMLSVVPEQAGLHVINISAGILLHGQYQFREFVVPINIEGVVKPSVQALQKSTDELGMRYQPEHNVISMPAVESRK